MKSLKSYSRNVTVLQTDGQINRQMYCRVSVPIVIEGDTGLGIFQCLRAYTSVTASQTSGFRQMFCLNSTQPVLEKVHFLNSYHQTSHILLVASPVVNDKNHSYDLGRHLNPWGAEAGMFCENNFNTIVTDALDPDIARGAFQKHLWALKSKSS